MAETQIWIRTGRNAARVSPVGRVFEPAIGQFKAGKTFAGRHTTALQPIARGNGNGIDTTSAPHAGLHPDRNFHRAGGDRTFAVWRTSDHRAGFGENQDHRYGRQNGSHRRCVNSLCHSEPLSALPRGWHCTYDRRTTHKCRWHTIRHGLCWRFSSYSLQKRQRCYCALDDIRIAKI